MAIVKRESGDERSYNDFQCQVLAMLDDYDYDIRDIRYIEEFKQIVITIAGLVVFINPDDITLSFEINSTPDHVGNLILILTEEIHPSKIHITDSFIITKDVKGNAIAVFGSDAQEIYERDLARETYYNKYYQILMSPNVKFYHC